MEKQKRKLSKLTILFYVLAILMLVYSVFATYQSYIYVKSLITAQQLSLSTNIADIIQYFAGNIFQYVFYGVAFWFFGYIITFLKPKNEMVEAIEAQDDWIDDTKMIEEEIVEEADV